VKLARRDVGAVARWVCGGGSSQVLDCNETLMLGNMVSWIFQAGFVNCILKY